MKKRRLTLIIIGLLLTLIPYFINVYSIIRALSIFFGIVSLIIAITLNKKGETLLIVILPIVFILMAFGFDYGIVHIFNTTPIFANKVISSNKVITYNSILYRVYSCNNKIIIDNFYKLEYPCSSNDLETHEVTTFLTNVLENYQSYKDNFVKITGKISKINGTYNLELQNYTKTDESINGYVMFNDSVTLEVNFNEVKELTNYKVYDNVTVIGKVDKLIQSFDKYTLKLIDSVILDSDLYNHFELSIIPKNSCDNDKVKYEEMDNLVYYTSCIDKVLIKYNEDNIYDLSYELLDKRVTLNDLINLSKESKEENGNTLYIYDDFNILKCANQNEIIIGTKKLEVNSPYCEVEEPNNEEL